MTARVETITADIMSVAPVATALPQTAAWHPAEHTTVSIPATDVDTTMAVHLQRGISETAIQPQTVPTVHRVATVRQPQGCTSRLHPLRTDVTAPRHSVPRRPHRTLRPRPSTRTATTATTGVTTPTVTTILTTTGTHTTAARTTAAVVQAEVTVAEAVEAAAVAPVEDTEDN